MMIILSKGILRQSIFEYATRTFLYETWNSLTFLVEVKKLVLREKYVCNFLTDRDKFCKKIFQIFLKNWIHYLVVQLHQNHTKHSYSFGKDLCRHLNHNTGNNSCIYARYIKWVQLGEQLRRRKSTSIKRNI